MSGSVQTGSEDHMTFYQVHTVSLGIKRPAREANHLFPFTAEVKGWDYNFTRPYAVNGVGLY
jgi:hypothetical protein